jgi:uncharacterized membrane protein YqjE
MQSRESDAGIGDAVRAVSDRAATLAKLEVRLARLELAGKLKRLSRAGVYGAAASVLALFGLGFGLAAAAAGLDAVLPRWLALLVVAVALVALAAVLTAAAVAAARRSGPPVPDQAIGEAKETRRVLQEVNGR